MEKKAKECVKEGFGTIVTVPALATPGMKLEFDQCSATPKP